MSEDSRVICAVTGANKGIGLEIVRQLAARGARVVLTARDPERGRAAAEGLAGQKLDVVFHPLDVTRPQDVAALRTFVEKSFPRLDVLVNNAGIFGDAEGALTVGLDPVRRVMEANVYGPLAVTQALLPWLKKSPRPRVVNMSSGMGALSEMGGGYAAYRISKAALNALTGILSAELSGTPAAVNSMCPGWVRTDMGGPNAPRSVQEGADTAVWLALDAPPSARGKFFRDRKEIAW